MPREIVSLMSKSFSLSFFLVGSLHCCCHRLRASRRNDYVKAKAAHTVSSFIHLIMQISALSLLQFRTHTQQAGRIRFVIFVTNTTRSAPAVGLQPQHKNDSLYYIHTPFFARQKHNMKFAEKRVISEIALRCRALSTSKVWVINLLRNFESILAIAIMMRGSCYNIYGIAGASFGAPSI